MYIICKNLIFILCFLWEQSIGKITLVVKFEIELENWRRATLLLWVNRRVIFFWRTWAVIHYWSWTYINTSEGTVLWKMIRDKLKLNFVIMGAWINHIVVSIFSSTTKRPLTANVFTPEMSTMFVTDIDHPKNFSSQGVPIYSNRKTPSSVNLEITIMFVSNVVISLCDVWFFIWFDLIGEILYVSFTVVLFYVYFYTHF